MNQGIVSRIITIAVLIALVFVACSKGSLTDDPVTPVDEGPAIALDFTQNTISKDLVDSAIIILKKKNTQIYHLLRFVNSNADWQVPIDGFSAGEYSASVYLYTRVSESDAHREYESLNTIVIYKNTTRISITSPNGTLNDSWKPRAILSYNKEIDFYVSLDNSDPYFRIRVANGEKWKKLEIERSATKKIAGTGTELIARSKWTCEASCFVNDNLLENSTAFEGFANDVKDKNWNFGEIEILAETRDGLKTEDYFRYNR